MPQSHVQVFSGLLETLKALSGIGIGIDTSVESHEFYGGKSGSGGQPLADVRIRRDADWSQRRLIRGDHSQMEELNALGDHILAYFSAESFETSSRLAWDLPTCFHLS